MPDIPVYPVKKPEVVDPVARSMAKLDACAKPCSMGKGVRVRVNLGKDSKSAKPRKRKRDPRDVHFF